jgi:hypothetical protein
MMCFCSYYYTPVRLALGWCFYLFGLVTRQDFVID